jgi:hypothetical protein
MQRTKVRIFLAIYTLASQVAMGAKWESQRVKKSDGGAKSKSLFIKVTRSKIKFYFITFDVLFLSNIIY